jgi:hypothetical protein
MAAPKGNLNAEKWTIEQATDLFQKAIDIASDKESDDNDFIGEIAQTLGVSLTTMDYLKTKFPELEQMYITIKSYCEANCFRNGKKNKIVPSLAIMNLKSNHGWTDRSQTDITTGGDKIQQPQWIIADNSTKDE